MNELRYYKLRHIVSALASPDFIRGVVFGDHDEVYNKPEADKVIAELKQQIEVLQKEKNIIQDLYIGERNDCRIWASRAIHQKYKRCLAMAEACMHKRWRNDEGFDYARSTRHMNKWLELAEKFKDGV